MARFYEMMTKVSFTNYIVRVWTAVPEPVMGPDPNVLYSLGKMNVAHAKFSDIKRKLEEVPDIMAYEILDIEGNGAVIYTEWP